MALTDIVQVTILTSSTAPKQADFGTPLILGKTPWADRVRTYNEVADLLVDGFVNTDPVYLAASKLLSQSPRVPSFKVGKRLNLPVSKYRYTPVAANNTAYTINVGITGTLQAATFTSGGAATVAQITAGLKTAIDTLGLGGVTTTDNTTSLDVAVTVGNWLNIGIDPTLLTRGLMAVADQTPEPGISADLDAVLQFDSNWYGFTSVWPNTLEAVAAAGWAETNKRQFFPQTMDTNVATATSGSLADTLKAANYKYTALMYSGISGEFAGAAWMGNKYPLQAGAENWMFAQLVGVTPSLLTPTHRTNLTGHNCNFFVTEAGISIAFLGITSGGQYIDITRGNDWLTNDIATGIYGALAGSTTKVPYTDEGIAICEGQLRASLQRAVDRKFLSKDTPPTVGVPKASSAAPADKAARILRNLNFAGVYAGAIDKVIIQGQLTV